MEKDPVCGMELAAGSAAAQTEYQGKVYYFCCQSCREQFESNPERYLKR